jgi:MoxR-like ATPase
MSATDLTAQLADAAAPLRQAETEVGKVLVGQRELVRRLLIGLVTDAHLLLKKTIIGSNEVDAHR